jgi:hypothetical protein
LEDVLDSSRGELRTDLVRDSQHAQIQTRESERRDMRDLEKRRELRHRRFLVSLEAAGERVANSYLDGMERLALDKAEAESSFNFELDRIAADEREYQLRQIAVNDRLTDALEDFRSDQRYESELARLKEEAAQQEKEEERDFLEAQRVNKRLEAALQRRHDDEMALKRQQIALIVGAGRDWDDTRDMLVELGLIETPDDDDDADDNDKDGDETLDNGDDEDLKPPFEALFPHLMLDGRPDGAGR